MRDRIGGLLWGVVAMALLLAVMGGCTSRGALRSQAEEGLALAQQLHWDACEAEPLLSEEECSRLYARLRVLEEARHSDYTDLRRGIRWLLRAGRPYLEAAAGRAQDLVLAWLGRLLPVLALAHPGPVVQAQDLDAQRTVLAQASTPQLELVRRWTRPAKPQRVRLGTMADGRLGVLYLDRSWHLVLEDAAGELLEEHQLDPGDGAHSPPLWAGTRPLWRDGTDLVLGGERVARGAWEAYGGIVGAVLAWQPCAARPCPATLAGEADGYQPHPWARELFGVDALALAGSATGTAAVASRENPTNNGWTLRQVPVEVLRSGDVAALQQARAEVWRPPRGGSLEDPALVRGAARAVLVGTLYDLARGPTGQVWAAEAGGALRQIGQVGATRANSEIGAVELAGVLYVAAEVDAQRSGLWAYRDRGLVLLGTVPGGTPSLAAAEGALWLSSSAGLWVLQ